MTKKNIMEVQLQEKEGQKTKYYYYIRLLEQPHKPQRGTASY